MNLFIEPFSLIFTNIDIQFNRTNYSRKYDFKSVCVPFYLAAAAAVTVDAIAATVCCLPPAYNIYIHIHSIVHLFASILQLIHIFILLQIERPNGITTFETITYCITSNGNGFFFLWLGDCN